MVALGAATYALTASTESGTAVVTAAWVVAGAAAVAFVVVERRTASPLVPLGLFGSRIFSAANGMTLLVYGALGGVSLFTVLQLQAVGWSALQAGLSGLPITAGPVAALVAGRGALGADRPPHPDDGGPPGLRRGRAAPRSASARVPPGGPCCPA